MKLDLRYGALIFKKIGFSIKTLRKTERKGDTVRKMSRKWLIFALYRVSSGRSKWLSGRAHEKPHDFFFVVVVPTATPQSKYLLYVAPIRSPSGRCILKLNFLGFQSVFLHSLDILLTPNHLITCTSVYCCGSWPPFHIKIPAKSSVSNENNV